MRYRLLILSLAAVFGLALWVPPAPAQVRGGGMRGGMRAAPAGRPSARQARRGPSVRIIGRGRRRPIRSGGYFLPPYLYPDEGYEVESSAPEEAPAPPSVVVVKPAEPPAPPPKPVASLLLVNRDGKWVRVPTGDQIPDGTLAVQPESALGSASSTAGASQAAQPTPAPPSVILIFRNGRREEIQRYVIQGDSLYATENYWSTGSWTHKIPIAELDLPATLKLNRERGARFALPSGPNEVVVGF